MPYPNTKTIRLLGDSIFDNAAYVPGQPPVAEQLQEKVKGHAIQVVLSAVDGAVTEDVSTSQLSSILTEDELLVLSTGGNDALRHIELLFEQSSQKIGETLARFHFIRERFRKDYETLLNELKATNLPVLICTIYNPDFERDEDTKNLQKPAEAALSFFNDVIVQEATKRLFPLLDLREVANESGDFANPIEPSFEGGDKITERICDWALSTIASQSTKSA